MRKRRRMVARVTQGGMHSHPRECFCREAVKCLTVFDYSRKYFFVPFGARRVRVLIDAFNEMPRFAHCPE